MCVVIRVFRRWPYRCCCSVQVRSSQKYKYLYWRGWGKKKEVGSVGRYCLQSHCVVLEQSCNLAVFIIVHTL